MLPCKGTEKEWNMNDKTEWEVVDEASSGARPRPTVRHLMENLLGRGWRWKVAGGVAMAAVAVVFFATISIVVAMLMAAAAIISIGVGKVRQMMGSRKRSVAARSDVERRHE